MWTVRSFLVVTLCWSVSGGVSQGAESLCARVQIAIQQEVALERQAFDASMIITNGLLDQDLTDVTVDVLFTDEERQPVPASSDPTDENAMFFIRVDTMDGIDSLDGSGTVPQDSRAEIHWLIIPAPGASDGVPDGTLYYVGATLRYAVGGREETIDVSPDYIFVKPMPELAIDYFLPRQVYGDDAFTVEIEPAVPFSLGARVCNQGGGDALGVTIESAQPEIVDNEQGLLIGFDLLGATVNGSPRTAGLTVNFGDIAAGECAAARWIMQCTISGRFEEFSADFSHADELGGRLTSLIRDVSTHTLVHDVRVDLPGRDGVRDFLARDGDALRLYESNGVDTDVVDRSGAAALNVVRDRDAVTVVLVIPATGGAAFCSVADPFDGERVVGRAVRSDARILPAENVWLHRERDEAKKWVHMLRLFDVNTPGRYEILMQAAADVPQPPVLSVPPSAAGLEGSQVSFLVAANDPNGTVPVLSAASLPVGAQFSDAGDGTGVFDWTPQLGQAGEYTVMFRASDGELTGAAAARIRISGERTFSLTRQDSGETLHFGFRQGATPEFDLGIDVAATADAPIRFRNLAPGLPADAWMQQDYRYGAGVERWRFVVAAARGGARSTELTWSTDRSPDGRSFYLQRIENEAPVGFPVDMQTDASVSIETGTEWEICCAPLTALTLELERCWNLIGSNLMTLSTLGDTVRESVRTGPFWEPAGPGYTPRAADASWPAESAIWVCCSQPATCALDGLPADGVVAFAAQWNAFTPVAPMTVADLPAQVVAVWEWVAARQVYRQVRGAEEMRPGHGYWLYLQDALVWP
jgi:hypothetical protein